MIQNFLDMRWNELLKMPAQLKIKHLWKHLKLIPRWFPVLAWNMFSQLDKVWKY